MGGGRRTPGERDGGLNWMIVHRDGPKWTGSCCIFDAQLTVPADGFSSGNAEKESLSPLMWVLKLRPKEAKEPLSKVPDYAQENRDSSPALSF